MVDGHNFPHSGAGVITFPSIEDFYPGNMLEEYPPRISIQFHDSSDWNFDYLFHQIITEVPGDDDPVAGLLPWDDIAGIAPAFQFRSQYQMTDGIGDPSVIRNLTSGAHTMAVQLGEDYDLPDMLAFFTLDVPAGTNSAVLTTLVSLIGGHPTVADAYLEGFPEPLPDMAVTTVAPLTGLPLTCTHYPSFQPAAADAAWAGKQWYLRNAPHGIGAYFAWTEGLIGSGVRLVDVERGWMLDHEDLAGTRATPLWGVNVKEYKYHGTAVLGIVGANVDNNIGCKGIAPRSDLYAVSEWSTSGAYAPGLAIIEALGVLRPGDVLLIESQKKQNPFGVDSRSVPIEQEPFIYWWVRTAYLRGVVVVATAGNGGDNLDNVTDHRGKYVFQRSVRDSGAIIVAAGKRDSGNGEWVRWDRTNYGKRVDCFAQGDCVHSLTDYALGSDPLVDDRYLTVGEGATSSAAAIVAGAALVIQGIAKRRGGSRFSPRQLRRLLSDASTGTPSRTPLVDRIGVMPNLKKIVTDSIPDTAARALRSSRGRSGRPLLVVPTLTPRCRGCSETHSAASATEAGALDGQSLDSAGSPLTVEVPGVGSSESSTARASATGSRRRRGLLRRNRQRAG